MNKCRGRMVQRDYIMGNIFHKEGIGKLRKDTVAIKIAFVLCLLNLYEHLSPWTWTFDSSNKEFIHISRYPIHWNLVLQPILYKFIVLGSLGQNLIHFGLGLQTVILQLAPSVGRTCALVKYNRQYGRIKSTSSKSTLGGICECSSTGWFPQPWT